MNEFLTEWLIRYGTGMTTWDQIGNFEVSKRMEAHERRYLESNLLLPNAYAITPKGIAYLKDSSDKPEVSE